MAEQPLLAHFIASNVPHGGYIRTIGRWVNFYLPDGRESWDYGIDMQVIWSKTQQTEDAANDAC